MASRDRHGRLVQADVDPRRRPSAGYRVHQGRTQDLVRDALVGLPEPLDELCRGAAIVVEDLPPLPADGSDLPLAAAERRGGRVRRVVVYRRPVEARAGSRSDLLVLVRDAVTSAVREAFGLPDDG